MPVATSTTVTWTMVVLFESAGFCVACSAAGNTARAMVARKVRKGIPLRETEEDAVVFRVRSGDDKAAETFRLAAALGI